MARDAWLNNKEKGRGSPVFINLCFLTMVAMWSATSSCSCHPAVPAAMDWIPTGQHEPIPFKLLQSLQQEKYLLQWRNYCAHGGHSGTWVSFVVLSPFQTKILPFCAILHWPGSYVCRRIEKEVGGGGGCREVKKEREEWSRGWAPWGSEGVNVEAAKISTKALS